MTLFMAEGVIIYGLDILVIFFFDTPQWRFCYGGDRGRIVA
jgi:hypothetical protein